MTDELLAYCWKVKPELLSGKIGDRYREDSLVPSTATVQLSADETVWPEIDLDELLARVPESSGDARFLSSRDSNDLVAAIPSSWISGTYPKVANDDWLVAYVIEPETTIYLRGLSGAGLQYCIGAQPAHLLAECGWKPLGWDVADQMLYSGLTNAPFRDVERKGLAKDYGVHLNCCGLFAEIAWARQFAAVCDQRLKDHRPFFPVAIWKHPLCPPM